MFGGCPPPRCGRITSNCAATQPDPHCAGRGGRHHRRVRRTAGDGLQPAAFFTGIPQFSLHARLFAIATAIGSVWRPLHAAAPFSHPGKNKSVRRLALNSKTAAGAPPLPPGMVVFFAMIGWGLLTAADHRRSARRCCSALALACLSSARRSALPPPFAICGSPAGR